MQFIDEATIFVKSGAGGNGAVAFHRTSTELGGPAGGDGGRGGSVLLVANPQLGTLLDYKFQQHHLAQNGQHGMSREKNGRGADDLIIQVPVGTVVSDLDSGAVIGDLASAGQRLTVARGGQGGRGNRHFATATHQTPRSAEHGTEGEQRWIRLELKLLADVGLLGFPNVGKSSFISRVSRARPKIADYPFTTLVPNLGVVGLSEGRSFVLADMPGLIAGASDGAGLGLRFLRHVERARVLLHVLDVGIDWESEKSPTKWPQFATPTDEGAPSEQEREPILDYQILRNELERYSPELAARPEIVALSKLDLPATRVAWETLKPLFAERGVELCAFSSATGEGVTPLLEKLWKIAF